MKHTIARFTASLLLMLTMASSAALPASADCTAPAAGSSASQVLTGAGVGQTAAADCGAAVNSVVHNVVQVLGLVVGIIAVIMVVVAGLKYVTSGGESSKVASAKSTLIYALVGLAIAALAQMLVSYVLTQTAGT